VKVLFFTDSILTAPSRYRIFQYKKYMKIHGIKTVYSKLYGDKSLSIRLKFRNTNLGKFLLGLFWIMAVIKRIGVLLFIAPFFDIIHFNREFIPYINIRIHKYLALFKCKIIYEYDDALFLTHKPKTKTKYLISVADYVICGNEFLYNYAIRYNENAVIIPTVVDKETYKNVEARKNKNDFIIGWIGAPTTIKNLDIVLEPLNRIMEEFPETKFKYICDEEHGYLERVKNSFFVKWDLNTYLDELNEIDIGIMPLYDDEFNKGKCGFKLMQYIALGKPVIASPIGVNNDIIKKSKAGYLCSGDEEWYSTIKKIYTDLELRKRLSDRAYKIFEDQFNSEVQFNKIKDIWQKVM
jgi:glycosyltransferase involved in cell wall biosynthesis